MYLHDYGDEAASFCKEEIQQGSVTSLFQYRKACQTLLMLIWRLNVIIVIAVVDNCD